MIGRTARLLRYKRAANNRETTDDLQEFGLSNILSGVKVRRVHKNGGYIVAYISYDERKNLQSKRGKVLNKRIVYKNMNEAKKALESINVNFDRLFPK